LLGVNRVGSSLSVVQIKSEIAAQLILLGLLALRLMLIVFGPCLSVSKSKAKKIAQTSWDCLRFAWRTQLIRRLNQERKCFAFLFGR
jgi:hypothetical protein